MKIFLSFVLISLVSITAFSQVSSVEKQFEKNKRNLFVVRFAIGEDASSGSDYLVYRKKLQVQKIRIIWSSASNPPTVTDLYFSNGKPVLYAEFSAQKNQYNSLKKGLNVPLKLEAKLFFEDSKLKSWTDKDQAVSASDPRWNEKEKEVLERFTEELEAYRMHLRGEL